MIEDVLNDGAVTASRFSRWFNSNQSPSGSRSSSLRSTPHEELEKLAGKGTQLHANINCFIPYSKTDVKSGSIDLLVKCSG